MNGRSKCRSATIFKILLTALIAFNLIVFMLSTVPSLEEKYSLFLVEYLIRLWTCVESHKHSGLLGRVKYTFRWSSLCDALATFPFFIETGLSLIFPSVIIPNTTFIRMFSVFRVLKTERYLSSFESVGRVLYFNREILCTSMVFSGLLVIMTATALYYADSETFESIPSTLYISLNMLTGAGGPDNVDTPILQVISGISTVFSVAVCAIPAAMLAWGFEAEAERRIESRREYNMRKRQAEAAGEEFETDVSTTSESSNSSWEEFDSDLDEISEMEEIKAGMQVMREAVAEMQASLATLVADVKDIKAQQGSRH
eukprot:CAMPEP_0117666662 /NCGR_PEP_ID=MMETSP0804-20121206/10507_1 /TAXON_ID=1074897 /ORGANISM="Tetraselmis astigmatica, Strain CCMP880" /LENGTH=313 /DNA_ID=CAMNT_0005474245 /DNA_START=108 /DNA_END=1049 /DNA_ORIENTATION=+